MYGEVVGRLHVVEALTSCTDRIGRTGFAWSDLSQGRMRISVWHGRRMDGVHALMYTTTYTTMYV